jgi:hypothetical protein
VKVSKASERSPAWSTTWTNPGGLFFLGSRYGPAPVSAVNVQCRPCRNTWNLKFFSVEEGSFPGQASRSDAMASHASRRWTGMGTRATPVPAAAESAAASGGLSDVPVGCVQPEEPLRWRRATLTIGGSHAIWPLPFRLDVIRTPRREAAGRTEWPGGPDGLVRSNGVARPGGGPYRFRRKRQTL